MCSLVSVLSIGYINTALHENCVADKGREERDTTGVFDRTSGCD